MTLQFSDSKDLSDLASYLERAKRLDEQGLVKLRAFSDVLAVYVAPIYSGSLVSDGPTVLGLRTIRLAKNHEVDAAFEISSVLERIPQVGEDLVLALPPNTKRAAWVGISPPRVGWEPGEKIPQSQITQWAKEGIAEVANTLPESIGSAIAARVRLQIWGKSVGLSHNFPSAAAFALAGLGFMEPNEEIQVFRTKGWVRLSTRHGHVLSKDSYRIS
jgi:hypothetical protein